MNTETPALQPIRRLVIAGGGTAGWMVAALISSVLGRGMEIQLVESDEIGTVGVGEATIPTLMTYQNLLGISEAEFMAATQATFKLGIRFENWRNVGEDYFHAFGTTGRDHWTAGFQHFWLRGRARGLAGPYSDYCLEWSAADAGRFAHLPKNGLNYAYHLDATLYGQYLRRLAEAAGVQRVEGKIAEVLRDGEQIQALRLDDGRRVDGDLFVDCTGFRSLLLGQTLGVPYEDWGHWLPCDSAVAVQTTSTGPAVPYTRSIAHPWGWQWRIPLQHRVGNGLVYSSRHIDDEGARQALLANISGEPLVQPRFIKFRPGRRLQTWKGNCVAIGLSSGFIEPLESTSIHLIQRGAIRLMQLMPNRGIAATDIAEYNRQMQLELEDIRDFIVLHYHVTNRRDSALWREAAAMSVPASLAHRIALFRDSARVFHKAGELFGENSWIQVMMGQGVVPTQLHPTAELMGERELQGFLAEIAQGVARTVAQLPPHHDYVQRYCAAQAAARRA